MARLTSAILVSALIRRVGNAGGNAVVVAKGDPTSGAIMLVCMEKNIFRSVRERVLNAHGTYEWSVVGPADPDSLDAYLARRSHSDTDLWIVELDVVNAEQFAAETVP